MISVRRNVFETNSSSTHSLAIPINPVDYPDKIYFDIGEYGWGNYEENPADYFYTALAYTAKDEKDFIEKMNTLERICVSHGIIPVCGHVVFSKYSDGDEYLDNGYIDHGDELCSFVDRLLEDEDKLLRFICGGKVFTGNDNDEESSNYVNREGKFVYGGWGMNKVENPYYDKQLAENFEWYYKGN